MNKHVIDQEIEFAYEAIQSCGICNEAGEVVKTYRGQISTFGAAITMGSLLQAVAFFSDQGGSDTERPKILKAVFEVMKKWKEKNGASINQSNLFYYVRDERKKGSSEGLVCRDEVINAAIAVKLAMNLYKLVEKQKQQGEQS